MVEPVRVGLASLARKNEAKIARRGKVLELSRLFRVLVPRPGVEPGKSISANTRALQREKASQ